MAVEDFCAVMDRLPPEGNLTKKDRAAEQQVNEYLEETATRKQVNFPLKAGFLDKKYGGTH